MHLGDFTLAGWRWVFYVNLPLSAVALFMIIAKTPGLKAGRGGRVDVLGAALVVTAFVPLLLALSWGGHRYAWGSAPILTLLAVTAASLALFTYVELKVPEPLVPLDLFRNRVFTLGNSAAFVIAMAFFGAITFVPLYLQLGIGVSATQSGMTMLPMMFGLILSSTISGRLVTKIGRYKPMMIFGSVVMIVGILLMTRLGPETTALGVAWRVFVLGIGLGPAQGLFALAVQNAVPLDRLGVATSSSQFFRQIGSTVGVAIFGAVMTQALAAEMAKAGAGRGGRISLDQLQALAAAQAQHGLGSGRIAVDPLLKLAFSRAIVDLFWVGGGIAVIGFITILMLPELPLRRHRHPEPVAEPGEGEGEDEAKTPEALKA